LTLNIGSSSKKIYPGTISLDIGLYPGVDVVADGKKIPFKDNTFDLAIAEMILEHVDTPEEVIKQAHRVLKTGGEIYVTIPFMFAFHGAPDDFNRYTLNGLKRRLKIAGFQVTNAGVISGPSSTLSQVLRYYLSMLFSFNSKFLFSFWLNVFGWLTFPFKYLDFLVNHHPKAHMLAGSVFAIGKKQNRESSN